MGIIIFFEDMANSLIVGPTMRPVTDQQKVSREKIILCYRFNGRTGDRYGFDFFLGCL